MQAYRAWVLVRSSQRENNYGVFAESLLRSEGFNQFEVVDLDKDGLPVLGKDDVVVLTRCFLRRNELETLLKCVEQGVGLVVLQPQLLLAEMLGWVTTRQVMYPGRVAPRADWAGCGHRLQTHVPIAGYTAPANWDILADGSDDAGDDVGPAIAQGRWGRGRVILFFYDAAEAVAQIRFGNAALTSYVTLGHWPWPHAGDMFNGWVDEEVADVPQADFHTQLLAQAVTRVCAYPLARLWYYEKADQCSAVVFQSDGDSSTLEQFETLSDCLLSHGGSASFYLRDETKLTAEDVKRFRDKGHTFGPHPFGVDGGDELYFRFPDRLREETALFDARFGDHSRTIQSHFAPWMGYMDWVDTHTEQGYALLFAYMPVPWGSFMCGSGRPLCFCDQDGKIYRCWQQPLTYYDDSSVLDYLTHHLDEALTRFRQRLEHVTATSYTALGMLSHPVSFATYSGAFISGCLDAVVEAGVKIYNGDSWLDYVERREAVKVRCVENESGRVVYELGAVEGAMTLMLPISEARDHDNAQPVVEKAAQVLLNGKAAPAVRCQRLGYEYLCVEIVGEGDKCYQVDFCF